MVAKSSALKSEVGSRKSEVETTTSIAYHSKKCLRDYLTMTRFIYDQFSKDYLDELLSPYGELKTGYTVASERREIDVYFQPYSSQLPEGLGILGKIASQRCTFEPYRNPVTDLQRASLFW